MTPINRRVLGLEVHGIPGGIELRIQCEGGGGLRAAIDAEDGARITEEVTAALRAVLGEIQQSVREHGEPIVFREPVGPLS